MVLRKLTAMHVIHEETWRQDNQYGSVVACLCRICAAGRHIYDSSPLCNSVSCVCSKNEVQMVLRKLIAMHVIHEETWRQDNQYGNVVACLKVNRQQADAFLASSQPIKLPFLVPARGQSVTNAAVPAPTKKGQP